MKFSHVFLTFFALLFGAAGSGRADTGFSFGHIEFESSVPEDQASFLAHDYDVFNSLRFLPTNPALGELMGLPMVSKDSLLGWLEQRVQVVVGEKFESDAHVFTAQRNFAFQNPGVFPLIETPPPAPAPVPGPGPSPAPVVKGSVIMSNIGVGIYLDGKKKGSLLGLELDGVGRIAVTSPRSGIIKVGPALFGPRHAPNALYPLAAANSFPRLATFFHEARHSDGNGKSLGFLHALCPATHSLAGRNACDRNLNGPYYVGGMMLKTMTEMCASCTVQEREILRATYLEIFTRVIKVSENGVASTTWEPAPEGTR